MISIAVEVISCKVDCLHDETELFLFSLVPIAKVW
jgi:hypothetical protein